MKQRNYHKQKNADISYMTIMSVYRFRYGQHGYRGNVFNLPQNIIILATILTNLLRDLDVIVVKRIWQLPSWLLSKKIGSVACSLVAETEQQVLPQHGISPCCCKTTAYWHRLDWTLHSWTNNIWWPTRFRAICERREPQWHLHIRANCSQKNHRARKY